MIPSAFQSGRTLRVLNIVAVGFSLATVVAAAFSIAVHDDVNTAFAVGLPTCALGMVWAGLLRWPKTMGTRKLRWGWVASIPLALVNGALVGSLFAGIEWGGFGNYSVGALVGATVGAILWIPGLLFTLLVFGPPLAHAQRLAANGLADGERGERLVGLACVAVSLVGLLAALFVAPPGPPPPLPAPPDSIRLSQPQRPVLAGNVHVIEGLGGVGGLTGAAAILLALARQARRRRFVADVQAGTVGNYRVDNAREGSVLVHVVQEGAGYRVVKSEEELFDLDASGDATRPSHLARRGES